MRLLGRNRHADARGIIARISGTAGLAAENIAYAGARIRDAEARMLKSGRAYIRENPLKASAITMALGAMAAGLILMGTRRR